MASMNAGNITAEAKKTKPLVAAIDFGTTYSGYAFSFKTDYKDNPLKISCNQNWVAGSRSLVSVKAPTVALFNSKQEFVSFGYNAEDKYSDLALDNIHNDFYYFRRFKMALHHNTKLKRNLTLTDDSEDDKKTMPAKKVFTECIRFLKDHLLNALETHGTTMDNNDIHWVLTVPAIWSDRAKQFMREAAGDAGIQGAQLTICLEPEAASLYCQHLSLDNFKGNVTFKSNSSKYMVVDMGGGTVDITVHEKQPDGTLKELHEASGGPWGGKFVDDKFSSMLTDLVGQDIMKKFSDENKADSLDIYREIETKKQTIKPDTNGKITVKIPVSLTETFKTKCKEPMKKVIEKSKYSGNMTWMGDKLRMEANIFKQLFEDSRYNLIKHLEQLFRKPEVSNVTTILMVGGFAECEILQAAMYEAFPNKKVVIPQDAGLAVLKGAVLFGHKPQTITQRISKYTYGINISPPYDPAIHSPSRKVCIDGTQRVKDVFKKYISIKQQLRIGEAVTGRHITIKSQQKEMLLKVFASTDPDPKYVTDNNCEFLGKVVVELPPTESRVTVEVSMIFGETELMVEAREQSTGQVYRSFFDFL